MAKGNLGSNVLLSALQSSWEKGRAGIKTTEADHGGTQPVTWSALYKPGSPAFVGQPLPHQSEECSQTCLSQSDGVFLSSGSLSPDDSGLCQLDKNLSSRAYICTLSQECTVNDGQRRYLMHVNVWNRSHEHVVVPSVAVSKIPWKGELKGEGLV